MKLSLASSSISLVGLHSLTMLTASMTVSKSAIFTQLPLALSFAPQTIELCLAEQSWLSISGVLSSGNNTRSSKLSKTSEHACSWAAVHQLFSPRSLLGYVRASCYWFGRFGRLSLAKTFGCEVRLSGAVRAGRSTDPTEPDGQAASTAVMSEIYQTHRTLTGLHRCVDT